MDETPILNWLVEAIVLLIKLLVACGAVIFILNILESPEAKRARLVRERIIKHQLKMAKADEIKRFLNQNCIIGNRRIR